MRRILDCDFFLGDADADAHEHEQQLRVFAGPKGIVIADARVHLTPGTCVRHGEAFENGAGVEFVFYHEADDDPDAGERTLEMRFVVKDARYDAGSAYSLCPEPASVRPDS